MILFRPPHIVRFIYPNYKWGFSSLSENLYLTFDDGPHPDITPFVLDTLKQYNQKATFFCVGENVLKYPEIVKRIQDEGHRIGNHTMRHENGKKTSFPIYCASVEQFNKLHSTPLFRPPYGQLTRKQTKCLTKNYSIIMWSWLSYDFDERVSIDQIMKSALSLKSGDIAVLHDNPKFTTRVKELLPRLLELLDEKKLISKVIDA